MIGRLAEKKEMIEMLSSTTAQILMLTGRRRVGKTYLIQEVYKNDMAFVFTGTKDADTANQLLKFANKLATYSTPKKAQVMPKTWAEAFMQLTFYIKKLRPSKRKRVIFLDEFPWIHSSKSNFLNEFSYWWNEYAIHMNILVVITGSATTWMIKKIINHKGGLHNRVTHRIHLLPFTLAETKLLLQKINPRLTLINITELYMCMGGIPLYLNQVRAGESVTQSINRICFKNTGLLNKEFNDLFASLFDNYENHIGVIRALSRKWLGMNRNDIAKNSKLANGGGLTRILDELVACNFIIAITPFQNIKKGTIYRLADEYCRFYLEFIEPKLVMNWQYFEASSKILKLWQGYAFENLCIKHSNAVKEVLGIGGVQSQTSSFYIQGTKVNLGFQIDMLIDRADKSICLCEIKYYNKEITITKKMDDELRIKRSRFKEYTQTKKTVFTTFISTYGINKNNSYMGEIDQEVVLSDLFKINNFDN